MKHTMTSKEYMRYHHNLHVNAIAGVCKKEGIKYYHINTVPYNAPVIIGYGVTGTLQNGTRVNVHRDFRPEVGEIITVMTRVW